MSQPWNLGEVFVLRHAGFPFDWMETLGLPDEVEAAADAVLAAETRLLSELRRVAGDKSALRAETGLREGRPVPMPPQADAAFSQAHTRWEEAHAAFGQAHAQALSGLRNQLRTYAAHPRVQEAVFLSAPNMFQNVWTRYLAGSGDAANADARRMERQAYTYLQRFCAKNETTSFFGPMGYGELEDDIEGFEVRATPVSEQGRRTFHAYWVVQEFAKLIARDKVLRLQLPLRLNPFFECSATEARCEALGLNVVLTAATAPLVRALSAGPKSFEALASELGKTAQALELDSVPLLKATLVLRALPYLADDFEAFGHLTHALRELPASAARDGWLSRLERLESFRVAFEQGDLQTRQKVLPEWEKAFTELTGQPARRGEGQMYMDRYVFYEEAASPFRLRFGQRFARQLQEKLGAGLELSAAYGDRVQHAYRAEVSQKLGLKPGQQVDFLRYAMALRPDTVTGSQFSPVPPLEVPEGASLDAAVAGHAAPGPRYSLPDVCLHASSPEAATGGQVEVLLARVHHHLLLWSWLFAFYPDKPRVSGMARRWLDTQQGGELVSLAIGRRNKGFYRFAGREIAYTPADLVALEGQTLPASRLQVEQTPQGPVLKSAEGQPLQLYLPLADFSTYPPFAALAHPLVLHAPIATEGSSHTPRLHVGGAVYQRERWELKLPQLKKLHGPALYLEARRQWRAHQLPRFVFARTPKERKPCLIDGRSPFALELLRHLLSDDGSVRFEEMYPAPDGLWLKDEHGRYTCELRMMATR